MTFKIKTPFQIVLLLSILALLTALGAYVYLGKFSYYLADDYCEATRTTSAPLVQAIVNRYVDGEWRAAGRYSNILFVGLSERLGEGGLPISITLTAFLWTVGVILLVHEIQQYVGSRWTWQMNAFLGALIAFMSFLQAPNLFQTVYWRSSAMTHFAPLVLLCLLFALSLNLSRRALRPYARYFFYALFLFVSFIIAGFSEPPTTMLLVALPLLAGAVWRWDKSPSRKRLLTSIGFMLFGIFLGFLIMLFSPAISDVAQEKNANAVFVAARSFLFAFEFTRDTALRLPLPLTLSFALPFLLSLIFSQTDSSSACAVQPRAVLLQALTAPLVGGLLIAASFAPSVFGQSYPVARMRFLAAVIVLVVLILEGNLFGAYISQFNFNKKIPTQIALILFSTLAIFYPLRATIKIVQNDLPEYRQRAAVWNLRQAFIQRRIAKGKKKLVVPALDGVYGVKELDEDPTHWVNVCAARFYGVRSIRAVGADDLIETLNE
ncbi:MAG: DUF6056 family protein [Anaerolineales bacterium]|nr:DUF6056 family protein [Anaerolineales bacterium]